MSDNTVLVTHCVNCRKAKSKCGFGLSEVKEMEDRLGAMANPAKQSGVLSRHEEASRHSITALALGELIHFPMPWQYSAVLPLVGGRNGGGC